MDGRRRSSAFGRIAAVGLNNGHVAGVRRQLTGWLVQQRRACGGPGLVNRSAAPFLTADLRRWAPSPLAVHAAPVAVPTDLSHRRPQTR